MRWLQQYSNEYGDASWAIQVTLEKYHRAGRINEIWYVV